MNKLVAFSAIPIELRMDFVASFISTTKPFFMPLHSEVPKPFISNILFFFISPIKVLTLVVPISIAAIYSSFAGNPTSDSFSHFINILSIFLISMTL